LAAGLKLNPREVPSPLIGKPAPAFALPRLEDAAQTLRREDLLGQVWILNVWASWCTSCRQEHPVLMDLARMQLAPVYGLNYKDAREPALHLLQQTGNPYRANLFDPQGTAAIDWGVYGVPETFVIDKAGVIRLKLTGPLTPERVRDELAPLVRKLNA
jgi:cytochrome c biogenesis protein CcmG, thiol:disulfide interchange protein DsbE